MIERLQALIIEQTQLCEDADLLDLILKLLISES